MVFLQMMLVPSRVPLPFYSTGSSFKSQTIGMIAPTPGRPLYLKFRTSHVENVRYLRTLGLLTHEKNPRKRPSLDLVDQMLSMVNFLKSKGFSDHDFSRLASLCPQLFSSSVNPANIAPVFEFLTMDVSVSAEESRGLINKCPHLLFSDVEYCLKPTFQYLKGLGVRGLNSATTLNAFLLNTRLEKIYDKVNFLMSIGLTYEEAAKACARFPAIFGYSIEDNLRPKHEYLIMNMRRDVEELKKFPQYFAFSLNKKIIPRHLHLRQRNVTLPLNRMLMWSDERFYSKWK